MTELLVLGGWLGCGLIGYGLLQWAVCRIYKGIPYSPLPKPPPWAILIGPLTLLLGILACLTLLWLTGGKDDGAD